MKRILNTAVLLCSLFMASTQTAAQQGFPDCGFSDVLRYYTAQANAGSYEDGSFISYWVRRLVPVWDTLPARQQQFYHSIFAHYDGVLKCRSKRTCSEKEMNDIFGSLQFCVGS